MDAIWLMYLLKTYTIVCPECDSEFRSYEKYINHVFRDHEDQPSLRMRALVREKKVGMVYTKILVSGPLF